MSDILCPVDLSPLTATAVQHAIHLARHNKSAVTLLHVTSSSEKETETEVKAALDALLVGIPTGVRARPLIKSGNFMKEIGDEAENGYTLMVLGTHGPRGLRQNLFGADILKVVRNVRIPSFVMQEKSPVRDIERIVMPVAGHEDIHVMLDAVCRMAKAHGSEVHVYQLLRPKEDPSDQLIENKRIMLYRLTDEGIPHIEVNEPNMIYSVGFAEQTIAYARKVDAQCLAIMAHASDDHRYIADAEKERLLTNEGSIPVLCG